MRDEPALSVPPGAAELPTASPDAAADDADVVVIGGGINGTGVARDLSLRGLKVSLFERNDLSFGASGNSSGMIHGGVRYLTTDPGVTETSCRDSGYIQTIAPHLLFRIPFLMPLRGGARGRVMRELIDAFFRGYDDYQPLKRGKPHCRLDATDLRRLEPGLTGPLAGGITFDEWGVDGTRLCARAVVNATGAWSPLTAGACGLPAARVRVRPGKGIHVVLDRRIASYAILTEAIDGRQVFLEPWQNVSVLGTTDDDYYGDLDDVRATSEEVRYLVQGVARVFPSLLDARAIGTFAGVRPTLYEYGTTEDSLSRDHAIVDHAQDGARGVYSMIGGKLASFRLFAQELSDRVAPRELGVEVGCSTHTRPLPGGDATPDARVLAERYGIAPVAARRLVYRHGSRALRILERVRREPREADTVCPCEPVIEAEVRFAVRDELARTVDDVARRTRLGLGACGAMRCAARCGQIVAEERSLHPAEGRGMALALVERLARARGAALGPAQAVQEALLLAHVRASMSPAQ